MAAPMAGEEDRLRTANAPEAQQVRTDPPRKWSFDSSRKSVQAGKIVNPRTADHSDKRFRHAK